MIDKLEKLAVYRASFERESGVGTFVWMETPLGNVEARLVRSTNQRWGRQSNAIMDMVVKRGRSAGDFNVRIIGVPNDFCGHYVVIGFSIGPEKRMSQFEMTAREAASVLMSPLVCYARVLFNGGGNGALVVRAYEFENSGYPTKRLGALQVPDIRIEPWEQAEAVIASEIIWGTDRNSIHRISPLNLGDYLMVRGVTGSSGKKVFQPVVNLRKEDEAMSPEGDTLETRVTSHAQGGMILDLPIIAVTNDLINGGLIGLGYVPRQKEENSSFFYKPVLVLNETDRGKYIKRAKIISKPGSKVILATRIN